MLKDRGTKKWVAMMLPEHVAGVKEVIEEQNKIEQPVLDEDKLNDIDLLIHEAMEYNQLLKFSLFKDGYINCLHRLFKQPAAYPGRERQNTLHLF